MTKAIVVDPSAIGRLAFHDVPDPAPGPNEAIVEVKATSLNLGEVRRAQSAEPGTRIGWDLSGVVSSAASNGLGPKVGARVVGLSTSFAWAEMVAVPVDALAEIPNSVTFAQAATLPVAGLTALHAVEHATRLLGRSALVTGASGGVGLFTCQIARLSGATVVGLVRRPETASLVEGHGARTVVVGDASSAAAHGPYRLIVESVGRGTLEKVLGFLGPDGVCVTFGSSAGGQIELSIGPFFSAPRASLHALRVFEELGLEPAAVGLDRLARLMAEGRLKAPIGVEAPATELGRLALDLYERRITGKAVLHFES